VKEIDVFVPISSRTPLLSVPVTASR
jgi:hypothetical protein